MGFAIENTLQVLLSGSSVRMPADTAALLKLGTDAVGGYTFAVRWVLPVLAVAVFIRCALPLLGGGRSGPPWGYIAMPGECIPLRHWENSIGRSRLCDVVLNFPFISRSHAVLTCREGEWRITDLSAKGGVQVNGEEIDGPAAVGTGDVISLAGLDLTFLTAEEAADIATGESRRKSACTRRHISSGLTLFLIVAFQLLGSLQLCFSSTSKAAIEVPAAFLLFVLIECAHYFYSRRHGEICFETELLAYFLCGIGLFVAASASDAAFYRQLAAVFVGVAAYAVLLFLIRDLERAQKLKLVLLAAAAVLMAVNLVFGEMRNGARNWINLGFATFQPMEFVKVAFVLAGASTLDRLLTTRSLTAFIAFSGACIGTLAITKDFGTALVFFCAFLVIAFMRSGDVRTIALITAGAALAGVAVVSFMPYVTSRFSVWRHVWAHANTTGYQQTRTMIAVASGGLFGVGGGKGYLIKIGASATDLVFGVISEEWGLIVALTAVLAILTLAMFTVLSVGRCRSSFYAIAACGAAAIFLTQAALNLFGSVDILPLTGVTMPFVSNGGSSMVTCWCLLALIKSADERGGKGKNPGGPERGKTEKFRERKGV